LYCYYYQIAITVNFEER